ncbi:metal-dependent hydrolase [Arthrobacter sp. 24S4-2]|uniref:amidohydrolase family protein n=1 Tax=Arthrobacter sp. 24S4-2 TaxID=2575374 RepID=UPI0010C7ABA0|nr:amidohydrolase family protein [Arthrobacter sp. 24S4-2]QCP00068.1 metal-dependent hydrolase [Arthrobacter sp. 24S4-2]
MIIDSHMHVWDLQRVSYDWLGPHLPDVNRTISFDEIAPVLADLSVEGVLLVQSADNAEDTRNMLEVAAAHPEILGVVGWVPLENPAETPVHLAKLVQCPEIVGIRNLIHDRTDPDWALRPAFDDGLTIIEEHGLPFDFVTSGPEAISRLITAAGRHPRLMFVLDHLGKPPINAPVRELRRWEDLIAAAAEQPNIAAKVSGLYPTTGLASAWTVDQVAGIVETALEAFGAERLLYGGDWPMSISAGGYRRMFAALSSIVSAWPAHAREQFWSGTATRIYRLKGTRISGTDPDHR